MGVFLRHPRHPWHSSRTLFTAHASITHVKAPQTDLHAKPDNSSGLTHDSLSKKPLRTKTTLQPKTAPKKHRRHQAVRGPPKPSHDRLSSMPIQSESRDQGSKGSIETQDGFLLHAQSHGRSFESIRSDPMAPCLSPEAIKAWLGDWFRFLSLWKERFIFLSLSYLYLTRISIYPYRAIYMSPHFEV